MIVKDWHALADQLLDDHEINCVVHRYFNETTDEEEFGKKYLEQLKKAYPAQADRINRLLVIPGIGVYITHWFLDRAGALCK